MFNVNIKPISSPELASCVRKKLKDNFENLTNRDLGEALCLRNQLELAPFRATSFVGWDDWEQNPLANRSWQWRLNWLSFLPYLTAYHQFSGDDSALKIARAAIESWCSQYLHTDGTQKFEFIWHDHATALRAEQLVLFLYYCRGLEGGCSNKLEGFLSTIENALRVHGEWLARDSFYSQHTNHGLEQARVLLLLGTVFIGEVASGWQEIAMRRISGELDFSFTDEGVHVENSPAYHIFVFKVFLAIQEDYTQEVLGELANRFHMFSAKALEFITHILRPDGRLPPIGDTEQLPTTDGFKRVFDGTAEYGQFLYALTKGRQGNAPSSLNRIYPHSGYAIFRDRWCNSEDYEEAFHVVVKGGCSSRYHHQNDEGHISIYAGGEDWLIDSGLYNYINSDPIRKYMRGRGAHNIPLISNTTYDEDFSHRLQAWEITSYCEDREHPYVEMDLRVLRPMTHRRRVQIDPIARHLDVHDVIVGADGQPRDITLQWHIPKDKKIEISKNRVGIYSKTGNCAKVQFLNEFPDSISVVKGRKGDRVFSCFSSKANEVEPSQLLRVTFRNRKKVDVTSRFAFSTASERTPWVVSRRNTTAADRLYEAPLGFDERVYLEEAFDGARVVLEYGSGLSGQLTGGLDRQLLMTVESDIRRVRDLRRRWGAQYSSAIIHHVEVGDREGPITEYGMNKFCDSVWDEPWFRHPDLVLIGGDNQMACLATVILRASRPVRILFDDREGKKQYQQVERLIKPNRVSGRIVEFSVEPKQNSHGEISRLFKEIVD